MKPLATVRSRTAWLRLSLLLGAASIGGCSDSGPQRYPITGSVTLDGQPVTDATLIFSPQTEGLAAAAVIADGSFALDDKSGPTQGQFNVRINPNEAEIEHVEDHASELARARRRPTIPKVYQRDGMLTATITGEPGQSLRFELTTKQK